MRFIRLARISLILLILLGVYFVFALPYNVDVTNVNVSTFQYYDNETTGTSLGTMGWTTFNAAKFIVTETQHNGSVGKAANHTGADNTNTNLPYSVVWGAAGRSSGNITYELDYYLSTNTVYYELGFYVSGTVGSNNVKYISFWIGHANGCDTSHWGYYVAGGNCLSPSKDLIKGAWEHMKLTCDTSANTCQVQFNNNGSWATLTPRTNVPTSTNGIAIDRRIALAMDNILIYNGTAYPIAPPADTCTAPASGNWDVDCSDNCIWLVPQSVPGNMTLSNCGVSQISTSLLFTGYNQHIYINECCALIVRHP